jgi:trypsin
LTYAWIGRFDRTDSTEAYQEIPIRRELRHPQYDLITWVYDVMLLELEFAVSLEFQNFVPLLGVPFSSMMPTTKKVTAIGWGVLETGGTTISNVLQEATDLEYVPLDECRAIKKGGDSYDNLSDDMLCTFADGQDHCNGDSGGPILWKDETTDTVYQVGVISL